MVTKEDVLAALTTIRDPLGARDVVAAGLVQGLVTRPDGSVGFILDVPVAAAARYAAVRSACEQVVARLPGVTAVTVVLTTERPAAPAASAPGARAPADARSGAIPGVRAVLAIASGKGGVGKSTTAVNLALGLVQRGLRVGIVDADVHGPSIPRLLGLSGRPGVTGDKRLVPMQRHGLAAMSIGFLVAEDTAMIWRGPMVMSALQQLLYDTDWGELDVLVVDLPPGTGDAHLTLTQRVPLTGAVVVSTPQDIALIDARRGLAMFAKVDVPVFGIVENMSTFICPHCGGETQIFGHGGARETAQELGCDFLGEIPLVTAIRAQSDSGEPIMVSHPAGPEAQAYLAIADKVAQRIERALGPAGRKAPRIVID